MNVVILGGGESGVGAAILAKQKGYEIWLSDRGTIQENYRKELAINHIPYEENKHTRETILQADLVVKSPGIPDHIELIKQLKAKGIPVISEIEFASRHTDSVIIGITGSNGKT
ncbi:MAG: UDP-N-acetylmuramoyl-L-alanine--D-glutamate ligase, partial [Bacteroidota bacterium]